jgi:hypothetical protein
MYTLAMDAGFLGRGNAGEKYSWVCIGLLSLFKGYSPGPTHTCYLTDLNTPPNVLIAQEKRKT